MNLPRSYFNTFPLDALEWVDSDGDAADGLTDRTITLGRGLAEPNVGVWRLLGPALEPGVYSFADVNSDGHDELLIGAQWTSDPVEFNAAYVVSGSGWPSADGLDSCRQG